MTAPFEPSADDLPGTVRGSWHRFLDTYEPLRSELYRYCRHLTRSPWEAEDLAQDALARAFVTMGQMGEAPPNPRAWLFRVASNLWIDQMRRRREEPLYGMLFGADRLATADVHGGIEARFIQGALPSAPRVEAREHRGEWLLLHWYAHHDGEAVRAVTRLVVDGDRVARLQNYFFTPDFVADICGELHVPFRANGYRWWLRCA